MLQHLGDAVVDPFAVEMPPDRHRATGTYFRFSSLPLNDKAAATRKGRHRDLVSGYVTDPTRTREALPNAGKVVRMVQRRSMALHREGTDQVALARSVESVPARQE